MYSRHHYATILRDAHILGQNDSHSFVIRTLQICKQQPGPYARIFVRGHDMFRDAIRFPRPKLEEKCELRGTDNVQEQITEYIFALNGGYLLSLLSFKYF